MSENIYNTNLETLFKKTNAQCKEAQALAARYAPVLRFDAREPFLPLAAGYTIFHESGASPSFRQGYTIDLSQSPAKFAIEYAIWWDWDIGHLYELEHVWVYVGTDARVVRVEASWHGEFHTMQDEDIVYQEAHPVLFSEPGKHAFAPTPAWFKARAAEFKRSETHDLAGVSGILLAEYIKDHVRPTALKTRLVHTYLSQHAFEPSWDFSQYFQFTENMLVPWPALRDWMPGRINAILEQLARDIPPHAFRFLRVGHRGAAAHAPDNTLLSLRRAAELGADAVEFDVQRTADGHIVLAHDPYLMDSDGRAWPIRQHSLDTLRNIDLGEGERIPTFAEAIDVCREEQMGAYVELKDGSVIATVLEILEEKKFAGHSIIGAFRPDWLMAVKTLAPHMATSVLFNHPAVDAVQLAQSVHANYVHPCWERFPNPSTLLRPAWVAHVREAGLGIICWHEERPEDIAALRQIGVDGICSDKPELLNEQ